LASPRGFSDSFTGIQGTFPEQLSPQDPFRQDGSIPAANIDETIASTDLHATSDALNMLSHAAQLDTYASPGQRSHASGRLASVLTPGQGGVTPVTNNVGNDSLQYALIAQGLMSTSQVIQLIARLVLLSNVDPITNRQQGSNNSIIRTSRLLPENVSNQTLCSLWQLKSLIS
jgi:hypothetical protein